ncbi:hypothetical protein LI82_05010 [Methanococcoides methylutens]|uniref:Uncharacterized protein n=1 Tax=Methanococcoides methylutens TaxID=2226 RepID=A0A099T590_METMT|nr:hypothetical protein [Methanococcoides methylutens]KGK99366.1 hypothetical protein LI82_05010 [Methanococcoides methylutens]
MKINALVDLVVSPCGDCVHSDVLRTKCVFGASGLTDLNDTQMIKSLKGTYVRKCQESNCYCQISHVDSLGYLKVEKPEVKKTPVTRSERAWPIVTLVGVILKLSTSADSGLITVSELCEACSCYDFTRDSINEVLSHLKKRGDLLFVSKDEFRMVV